MMKPVRNRNRTYFQRQHRTGTGTWRGGTCPEPEPGFRQSGAPEPDRRFRCTGTGEPNRNRCRALLCTRNHAEFMHWHLRVSFSSYSTHAFIFYCLLLMADLLTSGEYFIIFLMALNLGDKLNAWNRTWSANEGNVQNKLYDRIWKYSVVLL